MIFDIIHFNRFTLGLLSTTSQRTVDYKVSIGDYLEKGLLREIQDDYLIPRMACVWSTGANKCSLEFPAVTLV